jgi:uncharacterized protein YndB with AHSA1/START domain
MVEGVEVSMFIQAPPDRVFTYLIDPGLLGRWWLSEATIEPRSGGKLHGKRRGETSEMTIVELTAPKRMLVSFSLGIAGRPQQGSVLFELKKEETGTRMRITHALPARPPMRETERIRDSWCDALGELKVLVERGPRAG